MQWVNIDFSGLCQLKVKLLCLIFIYLFFFFELVVFADLDMDIIATEARNQTFTKAAAFAIKQQS